MRLARFLATWISAHPGQASVAGALLVVLLLACVPLVLSALPIRRVPLRYNLRNLQIRWRTTLVTGLAFTFVTALLTIMLSFVTGMNRLTDGSGHPGNVVVLSDGATDEAFSKLSYMSTEELPDKLQRMIEKNDDGFLVS